MKNVKSMLSPALLSSVSGANDKKSHVNMESIYTDSVTGEVLAEVLQRATGKSVSGENLTLENIKEVLDKWARKAADGFVTIREKQ